MLLSVTARDEALTTTAIALERRGAEDEEREEQAEKEEQDSPPQGKVNIWHFWLSSPLPLSTTRASHRAIILEIRRAQF